MSADDCESGKPEITTIPEPQISGGWRHATVNVTMYNEHDKTHHSLNNKLRPTKYGTFS